MQQPMEVEEEAMLFEYGIYSFGGPRCFAFSSWRP
jgi:hypothetical protein